MSDQSQPRSLVPTREGVATSTRMSVLRSGVSRHEWTKQSQKQLAIMVRDASLSMSGQKAKDAYNASCGLNNELANPINRDGFEVAIVDFGATANIVQTPIAASRESTLPPLVAKSRSTNITSGLEQTIELVQGSSCLGDDYLKPVVVLFTDGGHNDGAAPEAAAEKLKATCDLVSVAFGENADEALLSELATSPDHFYRVTDGAELRRFFAAVGQTLTSTYLRGMNATQGLTQLPF